jgi:hypothetical protein
MILMMLMMMTTTLIAEDSMMWWPESDVAFETRLGELPSVYLT